MENADTPAMPVNAHDYAVNGGYESDSFGLTKREYFAAMAMQGIMANNMYDAPRRNKLEGMAVDAVSMADALLKELDK